MSDYNNSDQEEAERRAVVAVTSAIADMPESQYSELVDTYRKHQKAAEKKAVLDRDARRIRELRGLGRIEL